MNKIAFAQSIIALRWPIVLVLPLLIVVLFAANIKHAGVETDWKIWFDSESSIMQNFDHFKRTFGSDDRVMIALRSEKGIFTKEVLRNIQQITDALWETKFIARVDAITNFQYVHVNQEDEDEIIVENFLKEIASLSEEELRYKEQIARTDIQTKNLLVSEDGKSAVIIARMVYSESLRPEDSIAVYRSVEDIIQSLRLEGVSYHNIGVPAYTNAFMEAINSNAKIFFPAILGMVIVLLAVLFRSFWCVVLPLVVVVLTILFIAGFTFGLGYKLNTITSMFPIFVVAIGIADAIHILWVWKHARELGEDNKTSIIASVVKNFTPALITSLTSFAGFISLAVSKIVPLQAFGILLAGASLMAFVLSVVLLPALLSVLSPKIKPQPAKTSALSQRIRAYVQFVFRFDKAIIAASFLIIGLGVVGIKDISIDTDFAKQFDETTPIRQSAEFVEKNIGGTISLEIVIDSGEKAGINHPQFMKDVERFSEAFMQRYEKVRHVNALTQVVKKYHQLMHGGDERFYAIPDSKALISQYMLLYSLSLPRGMGINDMMDVDERYLRATAMMNISTEAQKMEMYAWTQQWWAKNSAYSATLEGLTMISGHMRMELSHTMIQSILLALTLVTLIFWFAFKSAFYMAASTLPNIAPLLMSAGLTGWLGIHLDLGMAIVFVVIIGIAIDDTVHFLAKYQAATQKGKKPKEAVEEALLFGGGAIVITTFILVAGFGTFAWSDFAFYKNFGFISSIALTLAMVFDLLLLPAIMSVTVKKQDKIIPVAS